MPQPVRLLLILLPLLAGAAHAAAAAESEPPRCFRPFEARGVVQRHHLVLPRVAIQAARKHAQGELLAARLCRTEHGFVYYVHFLARNGHVARVVVDAKSAGIDGQH